MSTELFSVQVCPSLSNLDTSSVSLATASKCSGLNYNINTYEVISTFILETPILRTELFSVQVCPNLSNIDTSSVSLATANKCSGLNYNMKTI